MDTARRPLAAPASEACSRAAARANRSALTSMRRCNRPRPRARARHPDRDSPARCARTLPCMQAGRRAVAGRAPRVSVCRGSARRRSSKRRHFAAGRPGPARRSGIRRGGRCRPIAMPRPSSGDSDCAMRTTRRVGAVSASRRVRSIPSVALDGHVQPQRPACLQLERCANGLASCDDLQRPSRRGVRPQPDVDFGHAPGTAPAVPGGCQCQLDAWLCGRLCDAAECKCQDSQAAQHRLT